jgi:hypothetical protein
VCVWVGPELLTGIKMFCVVVSEQAGVVVRMSAVLPSFLSSLDANAAIVP